MLCVLVAVPAHGQTVTASLENVTRVESWSFFDPRPTTSLTRPGNPDYTFPATRVRFGVDVDTGRVALAGAFNYVRTENLPPDAIGPLALGSGGFYYAAAQATYSYQLYLSDLSLTAFFANRTRSLRVGRMQFGSGVEVGAGNERINAVKRLRLDGRLIGVFEWSMFQRRFDGVRVDAWGRGWQAAGVAMMPTQGAYEESANLTMTRLQVAGGALALGPERALPNSELQAFAYLYRDRRAVTTRPDNTGQPAASADVTVASIGGSHVGAFSTPAGDVDTLVWGVGQFGRWYGQGHRAWSMAVEAGHRWKAVRWTPWLRAGALVASGDDDPEDERHGTFFPMLPSGRSYALSTVYATMNLRDVFAQALVESGTRWRARVDLHRLDLGSRADRWYHGSGATAREGVFFGFSGRPSGDATSLGTILEGTLDVRLMKYWSMNGYIGRMWGGDVVRTLFRGDRLTFWYIENAIGF